MLNHVFNLVACLLNALSGLDEHLFCLMVFLEDPEDVVLLLGCSELVLVWTWTA